MLYDSTLQARKNRARTIAWQLPEAPEWLRRILVIERTRLVAADVGAVVVATAAAGSWRASLLMAVLSVFGLAATGQYRPRLVLSSIDDLPSVVVGVGGAWAVNAWVAPPVPAPTLPAASFWWWAAVATAVVLARAVGYADLRRRRCRSAGERALVVGVGEVAVRLADALLAQREHGLRPVGFIGPRAIAPEAPDGYRQVLPAPLLGSADQLTKIVDQHAVKHLVVAFEAAPDEELVAALRECRQGGVTVFLVPRLFEMSVDGLGAEIVQGIPILRMRPPATQRWEWRIKQVIDLIGAGVFLAVLSPLFVACAIAVSCESGCDGVLFCQERVGWRGHRFRIMKFRSLTPGSEAESQCRWDVSSDSRIGPVGRVLRYTSLDELPQMINVLRGDMSLVGPRPERPFFVEQFRAKHPHYMYRLRVRPGITGWAQIHGLRGDTSIEDRASYDNYYIENWSLLLDIKIMLRTVAALVRGKG